MFNSIEQMNDLVSQKLAIKKLHDKLPLVLYKYHRNAMFAYEWFNHPELMECRGHVYDTESGAIIQLPVRKSFNYQENGWWSTEPVRSRVIVTKKYNGSMAAATLYNGVPLVTTTGSFVGDFAFRAAQMVDTSILSSEYTTLFEIIDEINDPHIVEEGETRAVPLLHRNKRTGSVEILTNCSEMTLWDARMLAETDRGEGFMIYRASGDIQRVFPAKLKSPYYSGKKKLMRMHNNGIDTMYKFGYASGVDPRWNEIVGLIINRVDIDEWKEMDGQSRRKQIESFERNSPVV